MTYKMLLFTLLSSGAALVAFADDNAHPTGFRPPPHKRKVAISQSTQRTTNQRLVKATKSDLPSKWDSREEGWITSVKSQGNVGTCWAFAAYATLEAQLKKSGRGDYDFSEKNMANLHGFEIDYNDGGSDDMAAAYLLRWGGAIAETNDVYETSKAKWSDSPTLNPAIHVQNVVWVPPDNDALKSAIIEYGAVSVPIYWNPDKEYEKEDGSGAYYYGFYHDHNHAVAVIGWDDEYPKLNFATEPSSDGAWIIKNSYGSGAGSNGYYYVSYCDKNFATKYPGSVFIPAGSNENYTAVYGYDKLGCIGFADCSSSKCDSEAAVFTSSWNENIAAVGVYSERSNVNYYIYIYTNVLLDATSPISGGKIAATETGTLTHAGYTTIPLSNPVPIANNTKFSIVYRQDGEYSHAVNYSCDYKDGTPYSKCEHKRNTTYIGKSTSDGQWEWHDAYDYLDSEISACMCIKAYTTSTVQANDGPGETENGNNMLANVKLNSPTLYAETGETFGAFANIVGANGRTFYASWLAGFNPANKEDNKLIVDISVTNNVPYLSWKPKLGEEREYSIWGTTNLYEATWQKVNDLQNTNDKFFKVTVKQK